MVSISGKHFYIYEPTQLLNGTLVIPIFLYSFHGELYARCIRPRITGHFSWKNLKLLIPNPLPYNSDQLISVRCADFSLIYSEIFQNRFPVADFFANSIWGEGWALLYFPNPWRVKANGREIFPNNGTNTYHNTAHLQACHLLKPINNTIVTFCQHLKRCGTTLKGVELGGEIDNYTTNNVS
ncbi:hypothetical protein VP01_7219g1 [Puccinia sorghi]|uniref:Uncharacterized protein n=1 Tax=Puccinia sorghi TaxID=27349 RepID=A0A0L6UFE2_9BASI|nr:hypothetical protein VP01_7219g1 [Puccinia sorghi]